LAAGETVGAMLVASMVTTTKMMKKNMDDDGWETTWKKREHTKRLKLIPT
jgi:hypothetical protein